MADYRDYEAEERREKYEREKAKRLRLLDFNRLLLHLEENPESVDILRKALGLDGEEING